MNWRSFIEDSVRDACIAEVYAEKPGNVSPTRRFDDIDLNSFVQSAEAISPVLGSIGDSTIGDAILKSIQATRRVVDSNTNLGIVLLIAPLAAVPADTSLQAGIEDILQNLTTDDAAKTFEAIRLASPSGLGDVESEDVAAAPTMNLRECMSLAADRDLIAAQYNNGFHDVLNAGMPWLVQTADWPAELTPHRLAWVALQLMATHGDSLVLRKCGAAASREIRSRASAVLQSGWPQRPESMLDYTELDTWLRLDGHRRNPGTTADMIAAILFASLREGIIASGDDGRNFRFVNRNTVASDVGSDGKLKDG